MSEPTITRVQYPGHNYSEFVVRIPDSWVVKQGNLTVAMARLFVTLALRVMLGGT